MYKAYGGAKGKQIDLKNNALLCFDADGCKHCFRKPWPVPRVLTFYETGDYLYTTKSSKMTILNAKWLYLQNREG